MKKRIIALLLAFVGIFTLVGCNEVKDLEKTLDAPVVSTSLTNPRLITWNKVENAQVYYVVKYVVNAEGQVDGLGQIDYANPLTVCEFSSTESSVGKYTYRVYAAAISYKNSANSNQVIIELNETILLKEAKPAAIEEIKTFAELDKYEGDVKTELQAIIDEYTESINKAKDRAEVTTLSTKAKTAIKKIVAIVELKEYAKADTYEGAVKTAIEAKIAEYTTSINAAKDVAEVTRLLTNAKKDIKEIVDEAK